MNLAPPTETDDVKVLKRWCDDLYSVMSGVSESYSVGKYTDLNEAIGSIGSTETTLFIDSATSVSANLTIPSTCAIIVYKGGSIDQGAYTLTINGSFTAGLYQVFSGAGTITFGSGSINKAFPEWWYSGSGSWHTAINAAIDSFADGGVVQLSDKTYSGQTGSILPVTNTVLRGVGKATELSTTDNTLIFIDIRESDNITIEDMTITGVAVAYDSGYTRNEHGVGIWTRGYGGYSSCSNIIIRNLIITDCYQGIMDDNGAYIKILNNYFEYSDGHCAIHMRGTAQSLIDGNTIIDSDTSTYSTVNAIYIYDGENAAEDNTITNNYIDGFGGVLYESITVFGDGTVIKGNQIYNGLRAIDVNTTASIDSKRTTVSNNIISGSRSVGIKIASTGTLYGDFVSIANNIITNTGGTTIVNVGIQFGDYARNVSVMGNIIDGVTANTTPSNANGNGIHLGDLSNITIIGNSISSTDADAIRNAGTATDVIIADNTINSIGVDGTSGYECGIKLFDASGNGNKLSITGNKVSNIEEHGIHVSGYDNVSISENVVNDCAYSNGGVAAGIIVESGDYISIIGNISRPGTAGYQDYGIFATNVDYLTVIGNDINGNTDTNYKEGPTSPDYDIIKNNNGWVTENSGITGAIATGATVTHGINGTPSVVIVSAAESGPTDIYVASVGATTFAINFGGGGNKTFYWQARLATSR